MYRHLLEYVTKHKSLPCPDTKVHGGQHGAHLGPVGPRWAPCWPHEPCYQGGSTWKGQDLTQELSICIQIYCSWFIAQQPWKQTLPTLYELHLCGTCMGQKVRDLMVVKGRQRWLKWWLYMSFTASQNTRILLFFQRLVQDKRKENMKFRINVPLLVKSLSIRWIT